MGRIAQTTATVAGHTVPAVTATIFKYVNGTPTQLGAAQTISGAGLAMGSNDSLVFDVQGSSLKLFLNGNLATYAQDTSASALTSGSVGMYTYGTAGNASIGTDGSGFAASAIVSGVTLPYGPDALNTTTANPSFPTQLNNADWLEQAGNFNVTGSGAVGRATANLATLIGVNQASANLALTVAFTAVGQQAGLVARYSGPGDSSYYYASVTAVNASGTTVNVQLWKNVNGTLIKLTNPQLVTGFAGGLELTVSGTSLTLTTDTSNVWFSITGTGPNSLIGFRATAGATVSNFSAS